MKCRDSESEGSTEFSVSAPACTADQSSIVFIDGIFSKWRVFQPNESGVVLYPTHETCNLMLSRFFNHAASEQPKSSGSEDLVRVYHLLEVQHQRQKTAEGRLHHPWLYMLEFKGLEWEQGYYGARRCWGKDWLSLRSCEVRKTTAARHANAANR